MRVLTQWPSVAAQESRVHGLVSSHDFDVGVSNDYTDLVVLYLVCEGASSKRITSTNFAKIGRSAVFEYILAIYIK